MREEMEKGIGPKAHLGRKSALKEKECWVNEEKKARATPKSWDGEQVQKTGEEVSGAATGFGNGGDLDESSLTHVQ